MEMQMNDERNKQNNGPERNPSPVDNGIRSMFVTAENGRYMSKDYWTMTREYGNTPNGNPVNGRWVLRDSKGLWIDFDKYSNDLAERNNLKLLSSRPLTRECSVWRHGTQIQLHAGVGNAKHLHNEVRKR